MVLRHTWLGLCLLLVSSLVQAALTIEITQRLDDALPSPSYLLAAYPQAITPETSFEPT